MKIGLKSACVINCFFLMIATLSVSASDKRPSVIQIFKNAVDDGFSGTVLVRHRGEIVLNEAAGFANRDLKTLNTVDTVFDMGSITKQYTGALIMALQEAKLLTVEDTLADHFDNVREDKADITIHQLLTHTAGFVDGFGADEDPIDRDDYLLLAWTTQLDYSPGTKHRYSNVGYSIAAAIAEIVTGQSYEAALNKYILEPAKLSETGYLQPDWSNHTLAIGYRERHSLEEMSSWAEDGPYWNLRGNGGLLTTTSDLLKWHDALSGEVVLNANSIETMQSPHVDETLGRKDADESGVRFYGYGWVIQNWSSVGVVHMHNGGNGYFYAFIGRSIDEDSVIVMLSNEHNDAADRLVLALANALAPDE